MFRGGKCRVDMLVGLVYDWDWAAFREGKGRTDDKLENVLDDY